jgi:hypothetical protein
MALANIYTRSSHNRVGNIGAFAPRISLKTLAGIFTGFRIVCLSIIKQGVEFVNVGKRLAETIVGMIGLGVSPTDHIDAVSLTIVLTNR